MTNYNEYLTFNNGEYKEQQEKIISKISITKEQKDLIKGINSKDITVFADPYCPDCRTLVAILENIVKLNDKININYISRDKKLEDLKSISIEAKIPTVVLNGKVVLSEFPDKIKEKIAKSNLSSEIIYDYRVGKYNNDIIESIIEFLR